MTNYNLLFFLLGFLTGAIPILAFIAWYYARARKRVESIKDAIAKYNAAQRSVKSAADSVFGEEKKQ